MSQGTEGRDHTNNTAAAKSHINTPPKNENGGTMGAQAVKETSSHAAVELSIETDDYAMDSTNKSVASSLPPRRTNSTYSSRTTPENGAKHRNKQPPLMEPPVTKTTLSELDVNKIVHNPKLRHDINFDPDLHFRPNLDGEKGRRKNQKMEKFYETLETQLRDYLVNREQFETELGGAEWSLPATLKAIRGILETLVPQRDRLSVEETFNVDLLMQQFRKGVADLPKLASWLSQLLKCHCAPMRDAWVDNMVNEISKGDQEGDVALLAQGMRSLLGVLEAMKLDVANHQIRCLRPLLIEDTVQFEQKFFMKKIAMGRLDIVGAHTWFRRASRLPDVGPLVQSQGNFWDFMKALVYLTLQPKSEETVPHTFLFDEERLFKLRSDVEDQINLEICMAMFRNLEARSRMQDSRSPDDTPVMSSAESPSSRAASPVNSLLHSAPQLPSAHHFVSKGKRGSTERGHFRRVASGQQVWMPAIENDIIIGSASTSPASSPSSTASTPTSYPPTPLYLSLPFVDSSSQVRSSLLAILASSSKSNKWSSLAPSIALQILRSTTTSLTALSQFESRLAFHLSNSRSRIYQEAGQRVLCQIFPTMQKLVDTYTHLTCLQIFEAATTPKTISGSSTNCAKDEIDEIATRISHLGILHWRVWADLAYLVDPEAEQEQPPVQRARTMP